MQVRLSLQHIQSLSLAISLAKLDGPIRQAGKWARLHYSLPSSTSLSHRALQPKNFLLPHCTSIMDPLSITAAVVGLLGALTTVSKALKSIVSLISGSPHVLSSLITEINEMYMAVSVLNRLVEDIEESSTRNKSYISLEQLVATLTEAVLTVSAIEAQIKGLTGFGTSSALGVHMRTALNLPKMQTLVDRLQRNKSSLNLMFNIVQW